MGFNIVIKLHNHDYYLILEHFHHLRKKLQIVLAILSISLQRLPNSM